MIRLPYISIFVQAAYR